MQIRDKGNGDLLWDASDISGQWSADKFGQVAEILKSLLSDITVKTEAYASDEMMANLYSRKECDERFVIYDRLVNEVKRALDGMRAEQSLITTDVTDEMNARLLTLYNACFGTNFEGDVTSAQSYNQTMQSLRDTYDAVSNNVTRLMNDFYQRSGSAGGALDFSSFKFALSATVGVLTSLSSGIAGRGSVVDAINNVYTQLTAALTRVSNLEGRLNNVSTMGAATSMEGNIKSISSSVNSINSQIGTLNTQIATLNSNISTINGTLTNINKTLEDYGKRITALEAKG